QLVTLATEECDSPARLGVGGDPRCLSFQIRGVALQRIELYNLSRDPGATVDLVRRRTALRQALVLRLGDYRRSRVAEPAAAGLSEEARETLRALGYLD
ncbi:MAG: hypothetical protein V3T81_08365, partial [Thermoanaerobaculia bacterium]